MAAPAFDWVYIDGDHGYRGVRRDAEAALGRLRPGGLLIFNDDLRWSAVEARPDGVVTCVNGLVNDGLHVVGIALSAHGYHAIALRAPPEG